MSTSPLNWRLWLVPGLLVLLAAGQLAIASSYDLTSWKGGGFGMFATTERRWSYSLTVFITRESGERFAAAIPSALSPLAFRARSMPGGPYLKEIGASLFETDWSFSSNNPPTKPRAKFFTHDSASFPVEANQRAGEHTFRAQKVEVYLWEYTLSDDLKHLERRQLYSVHASAEGVRVGE